MKKLIFATTTLLLGLAPLCAQLADVDILEKEGLPPEMDESATQWLVAPPIKNDAVPAAAARAFVFEDIAEKVGLLPHAAAIFGHGAGWGDVDGDGWIDLYIGNFNDKPDSKPNMFFRNVGGKFQLDEQEALAIATRATGVVFADLDNDGDLDLYVGSMPAPEGSRIATRMGHPIVGNTLFRNDGGGQFTNISEGNGACPPAFGGRSATVLDFDGDNLLDILAGEEPTTGYSGSPTRSTRLFRNLGNLQFEDVTQAVGIPENIPGYGVAAADLNNDTWPDIFIASSRGGNVLFLNDGAGKFREAPGSRELFAWDDRGEGDNMVCGVAFGDVNRDGLLDIVLGQHYSQPWQEPVANRLYLNRGIENGNPVYEDVTEAVGLKPMPMKSPHVEIQDFDNDGWPDIYTSLVKFDADGKQHPMIFKNTGVENGLPRFTEDVLASNDFPNAQDRAITNNGQFFDKMIAEQKIIYMAPGPSGDFDNDGRLDLFLPNWWPESDSLLLHNQTPGGNWLQVQVELARNFRAVNRMGIGTRIKIYPSGKLDDATALIGVQDISTGYGYASGQPAIAHFGLGELTEVDLEIILPHGKGHQEIKAVKANQRLKINPDWKVVLELLKANAVR